MSIKSILTVLLLVPLLSMAQKSQFACPMKKAKIIIEERGFNDGKRNPGAVIEGKNKKVYSCSRGSVKAIDSVNGLIRVHVEFDNYFFTYNNLQSISVSNGQLVKAGDLIGIVAEQERLFLIVSKDKSLIDPGSVLKCKVVHRSL